MRVVIALGGNALLERGEAPDSDIQETHVVSAVKALAPLAGRHQLLITHGNGPQVGVLALESARDPALSRPYPFDVLGAQTQGMIGYWLVQALHRAVPGKTAGCLLCRTVVRADDPAFASPAKFVGPVYEEARARQLAAARGWAIRQDGQTWRRVVPSPEPVELVELEMSASQCHESRHRLCSRRAVGWTSRSRMERTSDGNLQRQPPQPDRAHAHDGGRDRPGSRAGLQIMCDGCHAARAKVEVITDAGSIFLCQHHQKRHRSSILAAGHQIRGRLGD